MFGKSVFKCLAKVFSNVWQECFQTFGKSVFKRLAIIFGTLHRIAAKRHVHSLPNTHNKSLVVTWISHRDCTMCNEYLTDVRWGFDARKDIVI